MIQAWKIFIHSVRQVFGNLGGALRVSGLLYVVQVGAGLAFLGPVLQDQAAMRAAMEAGTFPWGVFSIVLIVSVFTGLWIAVGWHRYVLMVEQPGVVPPFRGGRLLAYLGAGLLLGLVMIVLAIVAVVVGGVIGAIMAQRGSGGGTLLGVIVVVGLTFVLISLLLTLFYRLSPILPAAALGSPLTFSQAWVATKGSSGNLLLIALGGVLVSKGIGWVADGVLGELPILMAVWSFVFTWIILMIGISILTTLYGHYVEKRPLV